MDLEQYADSWKQKILDFDPTGLTAFDSLETENINLNSAFVLSSDYLIEKQIDLDKIKILESIISSQEELENTDEENENNEEE